MRISRASFASRRLAVALVAMCLASAAHAEGKSKMFTIPADEGYGVAECFSPGQSCGKVVADAYCEANGWGAALAYGRREDITAALPAAESAPATPGEALVVSCAE